MSEVTAETTDMREARKRYWCRDDAALDRAADHRCLGEDVSNGEPTVCGVCIVTPSAVTVEPTMGIRPACPTCEGPNRETVNMVCPTCGFDYGRMTTPSGEAGDPT